MKVLILSSYDEIRTAESIAAVCTSFWTEPAIYGDSGSCNGGLYSCLESNDLVLIIWDDEMIQKHEITFSTGYCVGKDKPFVLYKDNKQVPPLCNGKAIIFLKRADLKAFILEEVKKDKKQKRKEVAKSRILEMGFEIDIRDFVEVVSEGETMVAVRKGHVQIATLLIDNGADINTVSGDRGNTPVMDAAAEIHFEILTRLVNAGAMLDIKSKSGQTALVLAVGRQDEDAALFKLDRVLSLLGKDNK